MRELKVNDHTIKLIKGNIALLEIDAVVNAANKSLILGGGVAGAIRNLGGPAIQEECNKIGPIEVGEAVITTAGNLKTKYIIHVAGPVYGEGDEDKKLSLATINSLIIANKLGLKNIAFPAISTGIFRFPMKKCSEIMLENTIDFLSKQNKPEDVIFCLYDEMALTIFENTLNILVQ